MAEQQKLGLWARLKAFLGLGKPVPALDVQTTAPAPVTTPFPEQKTDPAITSPAQEVSANKFQNLVVGGRHNPQEPVIVVGGGIAGMTTAWHLAEAGIPVRIVESKEKNGGVIQSQTGNSKGQLDEGAEFIDSKHKEILDIREKLEAKGYPGLKLIDSVPTTGPEEGEKHTYFHVNGKHLKATDFLNHETGEGLYVPLANRIRTDQKLLRNDNGVWTEHARRLDAMSAQQYLDDLKAKGTPIPPEVMEMITIAYRGETGRELSQISALALVDQIGARTDRPFAIYGESDEAYKLEGGTRALITAMEADIRAKAKSQGWQDPFVTGHHLTSVANAPDGSKILTFDNKGQRVQMQTPFAVSALPLPIAAKVQGIENLGMTEDQKKLAESMQYTKSSKIFLEVNGEPWKNSQLAKDSDGIFYGNKYDLAWPSGDGKMTADGKQWVTMLVGGDANDLPPAELIRQCKSEYAKTLGLPEDQIFTGEQRIVSAHKQEQKAQDAKAVKPGCYKSPGPGQYLESIKLSQDLQALPGNSAFTGSWMTHEDFRHEEPITWVGFANVAANSGKNAAVKCMQHMAERAATNAINPGRTAPDPIESYTRFVGNQKAAAALGFNSVPGV